MTKNNFPHTCWDDIPPLSHAALTKNMSTEIAIIGGGIAGLSCAYTLAKQGKSVIVIDDGFIGGGETRHTSAHLCSYLDDYFFNIKRLFGIEGARLAAQSHAEAIDYIEKIITDEKIDCDFKRVDGYLFGNNKNNILEEEANVLQEMANLPFAWSEKVPLKNVAASKCLKFPRQAQFHPLKYLRGLERAIIKYGGQIFSSTHARHIKDADPCIISTSGGAQIIAQHVIVATNSPVNNRLIIHTKQTQHRTYMISILTHKGQIEEALYWDTLEPYHYIRMLPSNNEQNDLVIIGGEDHKTGQNTPHHAFLSLKEWARHIFPKYKLVDQWSGQVIEPVDCLAFIGKNPCDKNTYICTGDSGNGLTHGTIAGMLLPDLIAGKKSSFEKLYDPSRKNIKAVGVYFKESGNMLVHYSDWFQAGSQDSEKLSRGEGAIVRKGLSLEAIYKDENGKLHSFSALCPHLGGVVRWNEAEKSWDCPCHGSRFNAKGEVINGPANKNLCKIK